MQFTHPVRSRSVFVAGDLAIIFLSVVAAFCFRIELARLDIVRINTPVSLLLPSLWRLAIRPTCFFGISFLTVFYVFDLYDTIASFRSRFFLQRYLAAMVFGCFVAALLFVLFKDYTGGRGAFLISVSLICIFTYSWRVGFDAKARVPGKRTPVLIIGTNAKASVTRRLIESTESRCSFVGFVNSSEDNDATPIGDVLGNIRGITRLVREYGVEGIIVTEENIPVGSLPEITRLKFEGIPIYQAADISMMLSEELPIDLLTDHWLWFADGFNLLHERVQRKLKRLTDLILAVVAIAACFPLMLVIALAVYLDSPGTVVYRQERIGLRGNVFTLLKFRSMGKEAENGTAKWAEINDHRVTRVGRLLRRTHLDELPQLFNILKGEMSFVGPRPERPEFDGQLSDSIPFYPLRYYVRPGLTGWAQVRFPYGASLADAKRKLQFDLYYILQSSILFDLRILLKTVQVVIFQRGSR